MAYRINSALISECSRLECPYRILLFRMHGEDQYQQVGTMLLDPGQRFQACLGRHGQIGDDQVPLLLQRPHEYILPIDDIQLAFYRIGLENIRRKVAALEGELKIVSSIGNGCELLLQVPAE
jgi:hypothetical protein